MDFTATTEDCDLIDTLWNVKVRTCRKNWRVSWDLIDTLWNVKLHEKLKRADKETDLIDTLWNVKYGARSILCTCPSRFNRYIVECKGRR